MRNLGNPHRGTDVVPMTRRDLIAVAVSGAATLVAPVAFGAEEEAFKFGLTPVFLSNDLELLGHLQDLSCFQDRRSGRARHAPHLSGNHGAAGFRADPGGVDMRLSLCAVQSRPRPCRDTGLARQAALPVLPDRGGRPNGRRLDRTQGRHSRLLRSRIRTPAFSSPGRCSPRTASFPERFFSRTFFTYGHRNVIRAVASGLAQSGSVDGYVWEVMREIEPELVTRTMIVRKSEWLGFPPVASPKSLAGDPRVAALRAALVSMSAGPGRPEGAGNVAPRRLRRHPARAVRYHRRQGRNCEAVRMSSVPPLAGDPAVLPRPGHRSAADGSDQRGHLRAGARSPFPHPGKLSRRFGWHLSRRPFVVRIAGGPARGRVGSVRRARPLILRLRVPCADRNRGHGCGRTRARCHRPKQDRGVFGASSRIRLAVRHRGRDDRRRQADRLRAPRTRLSRSADRHDPCDIRRIAPVCRAARSSCHAPRNERGRRRPLCVWAASCSSAA